MTVAKLRQAGGFRIDFFGGSELDPGVVMLIRVVAEE